MFSFDTKREPEKCALCGESYCLLSACKDAPLDSTHPATGQGLHALDKPKEEVEAQKS